jgi:ribosomal protein S18 acetylase RimI-like enzyme
MPALAIRAMTPVDLDVAIGWAAAEGWNPGAGDATAFRVADPEGFLIGTIDTEPVACISVVNYGDAFAFLGLYICRPEFRGRGYGRALWQAGIAHAAGRTVGLDGVVDQQANYARSGFAFAHRTMRYGGVIATMETAKSQIVELRPDRPRGLAGSIVAYDRAFFPGTRDAFLRAWLAPPHRRTVVWIEENAIRGYGCIRTCGDPWKIGPLFADTPAIAEHLFDALTSRLGDATVFLDVPEPNAAAITLAKRHGLSPVFETARMYRGAPPALPLDRTFGITTLELG